MKTKIALMTAVMAFSYSFAQQNPHSEWKLKTYSGKIDSIVVSEKLKMNIELDEVDKNFKNKQITSDEKQRQREEIASKYEQIINEKIDSQKSDLEKATREMVKDAVFKSKDTLKSGKNQLIFGLGGINVRMDTDKKTPKDYLSSIELSFGLVGTNLTSKDEPFRFYNSNSEVRKTIVNSGSFTMRFENQIGGYKSPVFYRIGLGLRWDALVPKYGKVFAQENNTLLIQDFTKGDLKQTRLDNKYLFVPVDFKFVLNPQYTVYDGVKYLDNRKTQLVVVAGIYGGVKVGSTIYNKYSNENTKKIVERERVMNGVNNFIFGGKLGIGYAGFNIFVQKDFTPTFNNNAELTSKYGLQVGIELMNINF